MGRVKYSLNNPPEVFVRKALESSDSEAEGNEHVNGKVNGTNGRQRRFKMG